MKRLKIKTNFLLIKNKLIFAFLWIQKRKPNEMNFCSKGQQKNEMFVHKKTKYWHLYSILLYCEVSNICSTQKGGYSLNQALDDPVIVK